MALTNFTKDMNVIAALSDEPNIDDGLTAAQLKAKFDEGGNAVKEYINNKLVPYVNGKNIDTEQLVDGAVTTDKLADGAVTLAKLADDAKLGTVWTTTATPTQDMWDPDLLFFSRSDLVSNNPYVSPNSDELIIAGDKYYIIVGVSGDNVSVNRAVDWVQDDSVTTAKILDENVTKEKLADAVQTSLDKADSAYQKPSSGIPKADLSSGVNAEINKGLSAYQILLNGIEKDQLAPNVQASLNKANTALQSAHEVPAGGTTRQGLIKSSNDDYAVEWGDVQDIIHATYGETSAFQLNLWYNHGYLVVFKLRIGDPMDNHLRTYILTHRVSGYDFIFTCVDNEKVYWIENNNNVWSDGYVAIGGGGGGSADPYTSTPAPLGTASAGASDDYARGDHVHAMPSASDVGAVASAQGVSHAGEFLIVGSDGNVTTKTMTAWQGGSY